MQNGKLRSTILKTFTCDKYNVFKIVILLSNGVESICAS